jgi:hypothetical protein
MERRAPGQKGFEATYQDEAALDKEFNSSRRDIRSFMDDFEKHDMERQWLADLLTGDWTEEQET